MKAFPSIVEQVKDLDKQQLSYLLDRARELKHQYFNPLSLSSNPSQIHNNTLMTFFFENSTRTKLSFLQAAQNLGLRALDFNAQASSLKKGENLEETLETIKHLGVDLLVYRTGVNKEFHQFKDNPPLPLINGGDGSHQHPTQALGDLLTLAFNCDNLAGKKLAVIGDSTHSRVCHSLIDLLPQFGVELILAGPKGFVPKDAPQGATIVNDLDTALDMADMFYVIRIQKERHESKMEPNFFKSYIEDWRLTFERLQKHNKLNSMVYHAGPVNIGDEIDRETLKSELYMGYRQVQNGLFMRMALIESVLKDNQTHQRKNLEAYSQNSFSSF